MYILVSCILRWVSLIEVQLHMDELTRHRPIYLDVPDGTKLNLKLGQVSSKHREQCMGEFEGYERKKKGFHQHSGEDFLKIGNSTKNHH